MLHKLVFLFFSVHSQKDVPVTIINIVCIYNLLYDGCRVSNWLRCVFDHPPPSSVEVKERVELYLYSPSGPSRPVLV